MPHHDTPAAPARRYPGGGPQAPETAGPDGYGLGPLDSADAAFRALTTGPGPLALNPARLARGMPDRQVPLSELKALLLHPAPAPRPATRCGLNWSAAPAPAAPPG